MPPRRPEPTPAPDALRADGVPLLYDVPGRRPQAGGPVGPGAVYLVAESGTETVIPPTPEPPAPEKETD